MAWPARWARTTCPCRATTRRPYKEPWTEEAALDYIQAQAGKHFDPRLVELFIPLHPQLQVIRARWVD